MTDFHPTNLQVSSLETSQTANNLPQETLGKNISLKSTSILLWTNDNPKLPNSFILKDRENKRYLGLVRTDRKGQTYWSFREIRTNSNQSSPASSPVMDKVAKFQQRQESAKIYGKSSNNQPTN